MHIACWQAMYSTWCIHWDHLLTWYVCTWYILALQRSNIIILGWLMAYRQMRTQSSGSGSSTNGGYKSGACLHILLEWDEIGHRFSEVSEHWTPIIVLKCCTFYWMWMLKPKPGRLQIVLFNVLGFQSHRTFITTWHCMMVQVMQPMRQK